MQNQVKRIFALLLMLCMLVGMMPMAALATETGAAEQSESAESQYLLYSEDFESYTDKVELSNGTNASGWTYSKKSTNGYAYIENGKLYFAADSDAIITKGIISLLIRVYNGQAPADILANDLDFIGKIGLQENLSPTRANGLVSMIKQIKIYAMAYNK